MEEVIVASEDSVAQPIRRRDRLHEALQKLVSNAGIELNGSQPWDVQIHDDRAYAEILGRQSLGLGESYVAGLWDCERLDDLAFRLLRAKVDRGQDLQKLLLVARAKLINSQSVRRSGMVAKVHYDLGNPMFEAMLGPTMAYSCGYWEEARTLDEAQVAKFDLICRKLNLVPGQSLLDIGCGWGGLAEHAARRYGCHVTGITISREQWQLARERCKDLPIDIVLADYRADDVNRLPPFDRIASVGMFEHVGRRNHRAFMRVALNLLKEDGLFLLQTIGNFDAKPCDPWVEKYLFPNGELPSVGDIGRAIDGLLVMEDWHNFGADYDRTLLAWYENFDRAVSTGQLRVDGSFYRMWRYYLLTFAGAFRVRNRMQLWQVVLSRGGRPGGYGRRR